MKRPLIILGGLLLLSGLVAWVLGSVDPRPWAEALEQAAALHPWRTALVVWPCFLLWSLLFPTALPILLCGWVWGPWWGSLMSYSVTSVSCVVAYTLGRRLTLGEQRLRRFLLPLETAPLRTVLLLRLVPVVPFHITSYASGALAVSFRAFLAGTLLGKIPGLVLTAMAGDALRRGLDGQQGAWWMLGVVLLVLLGFSICKRRKEKDLPA